MTPRQAEALHFIKTAIAETGIAPTIDQVRDALGQKSKSNIHRIICALEEQQLIRKAAHRARGIELIQQESELVLAERERCARWVEDYFLCRLGESGSVLLDEIRSGVPFSVTKKSD